jgi:hypothetical protein
LFIEASFGPFSETSSNPFKPSNPGAGFALSAGVTTSGLSEWIGEHMRFIRVLPDFLLTPAIAAVVTFTTEFSSNAATATVFLPLLAQVRAADPVLSRSFSCLVFPLPTRLLTSKLAARYFMYEVSFNAANATLFLAIATMFLPLLAQVRGAVPVLSRSFALFFFLC